MNTAGSKWYLVVGTNGKTTTLAYSRKDAIRRVKRRKGSHGIGKVLYASEAEGL